VFAVGVDMKTIHIQCGPKIYCYHKDATMGVDTCSCDDCYYGSKDVDGVTCVWDDGTGRKESRNDNPIRLQAQAKSTRRFISILLIYNV